ncbi:hypothetical protein DTO280E4_2925 [Paecilomyces variotii]|nr:hypothetical protein DTO021C3_7831 [Paecilomyces variotii]KAJ9363176.1 hypothetical protein DTO280E4_2925 [Paecilomyces variotii]
MDRQRSPLRAPSAIPRLVSRIPVPTTSPSKNLRPSPSRERLQADPGVNVARLRRPSEETLFKKPLPRPSSPTKGAERTNRHRTSLAYRPSYGSNFGVEDVDAGEQPDWETSSIHEPETPGPKRDTVSSLSDRTIETLSQIPPSPASLRRKSSFFTAESPMRPPSRPASSMTNYSRSPSRSSSRQQSRDESVSRLSSSMRLAPGSRPPGSSGSQRSASSVSPVRDPASKTTTTRLPGRNISQPARPQLSGTSTSDRRSETVPARTSVYGTTRSLTSKPSRSRLSLNGTFEGPAETETDQTNRPLAIKKTRKTSSIFSSNLTSPSSTVSKASSATSGGSDMGVHEEKEEAETRKVSKSSSALRDSIAKAKAARKATKKSNVDTALNDSWSEVQDPFNLRSKEPNNGLLRKRVDTARTSGTLNIAAMDLKEIPKEVLTMYDFDPNSSNDWFENVDLVKFIAADNELTELSDAAFPDVDPESFDMEDDSKGNQFGGLEVLDLHGNALHALPIGLRRLQRLHSLNLSSNQLSMEDLGVIAEIETLKDLKLANNNLEGTMMPAISRLRNLEVLDLHGNKLTDLPDGLEELTSLKVLNVGENQLTRLPFEILSGLPLTELIAPKNQLQGALIPASVTRLESLQVLNVVGNTLQRLSDGDVLELPSLQTLSLDVNRITTLPNVSSWKALLTLSAEDNRITALPEGFVELQNLRNVDLTGNDIRLLDDKIGQMENLFTFRIANNPLREKRFLSMNTEDLKHDLRSRLAPEPHDTEDEDEGSVKTEFTLAPESPVGASPWKVKPGGVLDRSSSEMTELKAEDLAQLSSSHDIRFLYLQRNKLRNFPVPALSLLAQTLTDLDLSRNPLDTMELFPAAISLPNLQNLNINGSGITSLEGLESNLSAPSLTFLNISNNRVAGALPTLRNTYPKLVTLLAADNKFSSLDFDAVKGLQVLDVSNNDINFLPPKIGLLATETSGPKWTGGSGLKRFEVTGNTFKVPRWQTVLKGTEAILEWLKGQISTEELEQWVNDGEDIQPDDDGY